MRLGKRSILWALGLGAATLGAAAIAGILAFGGPGAFDGLVFGGRGRDLAGGAGTPPTLKGEMGDFSYFAAPRPVPAIAFTDGAGKSLSLADFRGRVVLVNFWATWCAPCVREMPSLDRLQARLGGPDFAVLDISLDREGKAVVEPYFAKNQLRHLGIYLDPSGEAFRRWQGSGVPTSFLIDREGRARGVLLGPAQWDSPDAVALVRFLVGKGHGAGAGPAKAALPKPALPTSVRPAG